MTPVGLNLILWGTSMQMWIKKLLLILCLCSISYGANNFSGDANCVSLYRMENGALTTDSIGTNTLTNNNVANDTTNYKEGSAAAIGSAGDYMIRADADLSADFPFKSGSSNDKISICAWIRPTSFPASSTISAKFFDGAATKDTYDLIINASGTLQLRIWAVGSSEQYSFGTNMSLNKWYHVGVTYDDSTKSYRMRVWDDDAGDYLGIDRTGTGTKTANKHADATFSVCSMRIYNPFLGQVDEVVIFNDVLSTDEIDQIRAGTYGAASPAGGGQVIMIEEF